MRTLDEIIEKAIPLPECPVKKQDAITRRFWLRKEILKLYEDKKPNVGPKEFKA